MKYLRLCRIFVWKRCMVSCIFMYIYMHLLVHISMYKLDSYVSVLQLTLKILGYLELSSSYSSREKMLKLCSDQ